MPSNLHTSTTSRSRAPGSSTSISRPPGSPSSCVRSLPRVSSTATAGCSPASASTSSSCRPIPPGRSTRVLVAGSRSATRWPTCWRPRVPRCIASTTSTTPACSSTRSPRPCSRASTARNRRRTGTTVRTSSSSRHRCAPSWEPTSPSTTPASGATQRWWPTSATTSTASACTSTRGSPSARCTRADRSTPSSPICARVARCSRPTAPRGCAPPISVTRATACW